MKALKTYLKKLVIQTQEHNRQNILKLLESNKKHKLLDLGCDDGFWTLKLAAKIGTKSIYGVEVVDSRIKIAQKNGIICKSFDLNGKFDFPDNFFDVIHSNQVIEHLHNTDLFIKEIFRVLKPGGYCIISTVNLASWHNIFALILGMQPFDFTNISEKGTIGNPFALWKDEVSVNDLKSWQHMRLFTVYALKDLLSKHNFDIISTVTSGYYPLSNYFAKIDKNHSHMMAIKARKKA